MRNCLYRDSIINFLDDSEIVFDYDYTGIEKYQLQTAHDLFETIGEAIGRSTRATISKNSNFYQLGGNSLNSIYTVAQLRLKGYTIGITDFISAKNLQEILNKITIRVNENNDDANDVANENIDSDETVKKMQLKAIPLSNEYKDDVIR